MANSNPEHFKGHKSLADMIITHIEVWRSSLNASLRQAKDEDWNSYFTHELKALDDIEEACKIENGDLQS